MCGGMHRCCRVNPSGPNLPEYQNEQVLGVRLNWHKRYITLGPVATLLGLAFKMYDPEHLLGDQEDLGITAALIPTNTAGVVIGDRHYPSLQAFYNGPNCGKDVFAPLEWIIGGRDNAGRGLQSFDQLIFKHISFILLNTLRALFHTWTGGLLASSPQRRWC